MNEEEATKEFQEALDKLAKSGWGIKIMPQYAFEIVPQIYHEKAKDKDTKK